MAAAPAPSDHTIHMNEIFESTEHFARKLDAADPLKEFRNRFLIPQQNGQDLVYLLGNSLGLQPVAAKGYMERILGDWSSLGVESFFHAKEPWMDYHDQLTESLATIVGAFTDELTVMNQLSVNLHLMMVSFYRPDKKRYKIICEAKAFPSDQYVFETQARLHGLDPESTIIEVSPRDGEFTLRTEDIIDVINQHGDETALVLFSGINYYTGQVFDMPAIAKAAKAKGCRVGLDLAHAAGNVELRLHEWGIDFACWCSYKYLNSGPGAVGGVFIHRNNHRDELLRLAGWWGYDKPTRFRMDKGFKPMPGAEGWQLSTPSLLLYACHRASLDLFNEAGWAHVQEKRRQLTAYTWFLLDELNRKLDKKVIRLITPANEDEHGSQVSMLMLERGKEIYEGLISKQVLVDWREPNVIRFAPVPLYNSYLDVWKLVDSLKQLI